MTPRRVVYVLVSVERGVGDFLKPNRQTFTELVAGVVCHLNSHQWPWPVSKPRYRNPLFDAVCVHDCVRPTYSRPYLTFPMSHGKY